MDIKEAREIIKKGRTLDLKNESIEFPKFMERAFSISEEYGRAKGFIECYESRDAEAEELKKEIDFLNRVIDKFGIKLNREASK